MFDCIYLERICKNMSKPKHKIYIIFAKESIDLTDRISRGKLCVQAGHAVLYTFWDATNTTDLSINNNEKVKQAMAYAASEHCYKIALIVETVDQLKDLQEKYKDICGTYLVTDAGITVFDQPTTTCLGIGPISEYNIGDDLKSIKLFY